MAQMISAENIQKLEFDVTTGEGPCHVTVITGSLPLKVRIGSPPQISKRLLIQRLHRGNFGKRRRWFHSLAEPNSRWRTNFRGFRGPAARSKAPGPNQVGGNL